MGSPASDEPNVNDAVAFGEMCRALLSVLAQEESRRRQIVAHFHEWQAGMAIPMLRKEQWPGSIVFTTHATLIGRYLATGNPSFTTICPSSTKTRKPSTSEQRPRAAPDREGRRPWSARIHHRVRRHRGGVHPPARCMPNSAAAQRAEHPSFHRDPRVPDAPPAI